MMIGRLVKPLILILLLALILGSFLHYQLMQRHRSDRVAAVSSQLATLRARLEKEIAGNLLLIQGTAAFISVNPDLSVDTFDRYAREVMRKTVLLKNIGAAPDFVMSYVYPLEGNEAILGVDYREIPAQWEQVRLVIKANASAHLVDAVGAYHAHGEAPGDLACLLHLADNLGKDLGLGYLQQEQGKYSRAVLRKLDLTPRDLQDLKAWLGDSVVGEVEDVARRSTAQRSREPGERSVAQRRFREEVPPKRRQPEPAAPAASPPDKRAQFSTILDQLQAKLRRSTSLTREQREDLLVDVDVLRAQFDKKIEQRKRSPSPSSSRWMVSALTWSSVWGLR